jgi:hypothetical protein
MNQPFLLQIVAVSLVAFVATVGVYGLVALLVRMDDVGFYLIQTSPENSFKDSVGDLLVSSLPKIVKFLAVVGTIAMILVAGGIFTHNISYLHHLYEESFHFFPALIFDFFLGMITGYTLFLLEQTAVKLFYKKSLK